MKGAVAGAAQLELSVAIGRDGSGGGAGGKVGVGVAGEGEITECRQQRGVDDAGATGDGHLGAGGQTIYRCLGIGEARGAAVDD